MRYTLNGFETVDFDENEIRHIADGIDLVIKETETNYNFEDRKEILAYFQNLKNKFAKVTGWQ